MMYQKRRKWNVLNPEFILVDLLAVYGSLILAMVIRYQDGWREMLDSYRVIIQLLSVYVFLNTIVLDSYSQIYRRGMFKELIAVIKSNLILMTGILIALFLTSNTQEYSRIVLCLAFIFNIPMTYLYRNFLKRLLNSKKGVLGDTRYLLLVTKKNGLDYCMERFTLKDGKEAILKGIIVVDEDMQGKVVCGIPVVGYESNMIDYVKCNVIDEVFLCLGGEDKTRVVGLAETFIKMGVAVHVSIEYEFSHLPNCEVGKVNGIQVITSGIHAVTSSQLILKRCMDIIGGIVGVVLMGILTIFVAPMIHIQSPGPIFFSQNRVGKNGRIFKIYKFRTMYPNAEELKLQLQEKNEMDGFMFKMEDDPRIFPFGKILRKLSIDEFPQFINILKGDMSLVGTRPPTVDEYNQYELHHKSRLAITPGLTGMWQVSGRSSVTNFEEVVKLDQEYIKNWSILLDIKILLQTVHVVFTGFGSM